MPATRVSFRKRLDELDGAVAAVIALPKLDETKWPIVVVTMPRQEFSDLELQQHFDQLVRVASRGSHFVLIVDVRQAPPLQPEQRRLVAEHLDSVAEQYPRALRGVGVVLSSSVQRGIAMVLSWLASKPYRLEPFTSLESAEDWARKLILLPPAGTKPHPLGPLVR